MRKRRTAHSAIVNGSTGSSFERGVIFSARRLHVDKGRKRKRPAYSGFQRHGTKSGFTGSATRFVTAGCLTPEAIRDSRERIIASAMRKRRTAHSAIVNGSTGSSFERGVIFSARRLHVDKGRKRKRPAYSGFQRYGTKSGFTGNAKRFVTAGCLTPVVPTSSPTSKILSRKSDGPTLVSRLFQHCEQPAASASLGQLWRTMCGVARDPRQSRVNSVGAVRPTRRRSATVASESSLQQ